ncbi:MAG: NADH-quinone oxidoreductase subunit F, partial [Gammaproteobacteria bacterium]|nr:NADH-quinone oxidoreductase subunit F [Gammaproteobacteria bacterium]
RICDRIAMNRGRVGDAELLLELSAGMRGRAVCAFADALATAVTSFVTKFKDEFDESTHNG